MNSPKSLHFQFYNSFPGNFRFSQGPNWLIYLDNSFPSCVCIVNYKYHFSPFKNSLKLFCLCCVCVCFVCFSCCLFVCFLAAPCALQDLSFLTRNLTLAMAVKPQSSSYWTTGELPHFSLFILPFCRNFREMPVCSPIASSNEQLVCVCWSIAN